MSHLEVIEAGVSSIQGLGRYGSQRYGVAPGGAMDRMALAESNALTGQPADAAAIEIGLPPARFKVVGVDVRIGVSGADRDVYIDDSPAPLGVSHLVRDGDFISVRGARGGQYSYLSIQGGIRGVESGSVSRADRSSVLQPRRSWTFSCDDRVGVISAMSGQSEVQLRLRRAAPFPVRVVLGPQLDYFSNEALQHFLATSWRVSSASNRMAFTLEGGKVGLHRGCDIVSDGTVTGNIQIPGSGQPIVILRDRGTVGGYPKIATIITADLGRFAQTMVGAGVTFQAVSLAEAYAAARDFSFDLANLKTKLEKVSAARPIKVDTLWRSNLAGEAFDPADWLIKDMNA